MRQNQTIFGYYTIGNLNFKYGKYLPKYVKRYYDPKNPESNADRVLVEYNKVKRSIGDIFISDHYKEEKTYKIGSELLVFLRRPKYYFHREM